MAIYEHISSLEDKHSELDDLIKTEMKRPLPDFTLITDLKKRKLRLKEELNKLNREAHGFQEGYAS